MTTIVALEHGGKVYMGGDAAAISGYDKRATRLKKVFVVGPFVIGYSSSFRMGQLLQHSFTPPERSSSAATDERYLVNQVIPVIRDLFKTQGYTHVLNNEESAGSFLLGYNGKVHEVDCDFQVNSYREGYAAIGCGENFALGALAVMPEEYDPILRVNLALEIACKFSAGVLPPYTVVIGAERFLNVA